MFRPRDIIQRLTIAKELFPDQTKFTEEVLSRTEQDFSKRLWEEVCYSLSSKYAEEEIRFIEALFAGREAYFRQDDIEKRARLIGDRSAKARQFFQTGRVADVLLDLYRFGVIGNSYFAGLDGAGNLRHRWIYRGDQDLFLDRRMVLQRAFWKRFDAVTSLEVPRRGRGPRKPRNKPPWHGGPGNKDQKLHKKPGSKE